MQAFARRYTQACRGLTDAAHLTGAARAQQVDSTLQELADLPWRFLADFGSSRSRAGRILGRLQRAEAAGDLDGVGFEDDTPEEDADEGGAVPRRARRRQATKAQRLARRIQRHLGSGNNARAARALASAPLADVNDPTVIAALRAKHPAAAPAEI